MSRINFTSPEPKILNASKPLEQRKIQFDLKSYVMQRAFNILFYDENHPEVGMGKMPLSAVLEACDRLSVELSPRDMEKIVKEVEKIWWSRTRY